MSLHDRAGVDSTNALIIRQHRTTCGNYISCQMGMSFQLHSDQCFADSGVLHRSNGLFK